MAIKKIYYIESSVVLALLFEEIEGDKISSLVDQSELVLTSILTNLEVERALCRSEHLKRFTALERHKLKGDFIKATSQWLWMEINSAIQKRVTEFFPVEPLRTLDAIHLATALEFLKIYPELQVLSLDQRILANLLPLGLTTPLRI